MSSRRSLPEAQQVVLLGNQRSFLAALVTTAGSNGSAKHLDEGRVRAALDSVNAGLPHYKQIRAFHIVGEPFSMENGLLTANGQTQARCDRGAVRARNRADVPEEARVKSFAGKTLSWRTADGVIELALDRAPCNEIGSATLGELEQFAGALDSLAGDSHALIISSARKEGFCAGADLRELYRGLQDLRPAARLAGVRDFLERIHGVMNALDAAPLTTIAAVHGVTFGGGFELALACDLIVADKMARFCFPELRLGLIPGFGGIPRLKRDLGNAVGAGSAVDRAQHQRDEGAISRAGKPSDGRGRRAARGARNGGAIGEIRPRNGHRGEAVHQADPARGAAARDRYFLRAFHAAGGRGWTAQICGKHGCVALSAVGGN